MVPFFLMTHLKGKLNNSGFDGTDGGCFRLKHVGLHHYFYLKSENAV
jgi:hypothetical protein